MVRLGEEIGFVDTSGQEIVAPKYEGFGYFTEGLARVMLDGKHGFIDKTGEEIVTPRYDGVSAFYEGMAMVRLGEKRGYIDTSGLEAVELKYEGFGYFSEGLARVELDGKWGYIDKTGKEIIAFMYDEAVNFYAVPADEPEPTSADGDAAGGVAEGWPASDLPDGFPAYPNGVVSEIKGALDDPGIGLGSL